MFPASQTNSAHKHSQLGSQITEPISAWKVYFCLPPGEIFTRNLQSTLSVSHCVQSEENFFGCSFLNTVMGKIKKAARARSEGGRRGGQRKTSNEERNFKQEMLVTMVTIGYALAKLIHLLKIICNIFRCEDGDFQVQTHPLSL